MEHCENDAAAKIYARVLEAREFASSAGNDLLVHLLNMALVEMGSGEARRIKVVDSEESAGCTSN